LVMSGLPPWETSATSARREEDIYESNDSSSSDSSSQSSDDSSSSSSSLASIASPPPKKAKNSKSKAVPLHQGSDEEKKQLKKALRTNAHCNLSLEAQIAVFRIIEDLGGLNKFRSKDLFERGARIDTWDKRSVQSLVQKWQKLPFEDYLDLLDTLDIRRAGDRGNSKKKSSTKTPTKTPPKKPTKTPTKQSTKKGTKTKKDSTANQPKTQQPIMSGRTTGYTTPPPASRSPARYRSANGPKTKGSQLVEERKLNASFGNPVLVLFASLLSHRVSCSSPS